jgi:hypothetical protein
MTRNVDHVVGPLLAHVAFSVDFFLLTVLDFPKKGCGKILGSFDIRRSLKVKKMKNKQIRFAVLKSNERGLFRKSPDLMENMSMSLINYQIYKNMT